MGSIGDTKDQDNPKGYFENFDIVRFNDTLLRNLGSSWDIPGFSADVNRDEIAARYKDEAARLLEKFYGNSDRWVLKDPRMCMLLWFWEPIMQELGTGKVYYVVALRNPLEVANSQKKRCAVNPGFHVLGSDIRYTMLLWYTYYKTAISTMTGKSAIVVNYTDLISQPLKEIERIATLTSETPNSELIEWYRDEFIDSRLRRASRGVDGRDEEIGGLDFVFSMHERLKALSGETPVSAEDLRRCLTENEAQFDSKLVEALTAAVVEPSRELYKYKRGAAHYRSEAARYKLRCERMNNSISWKITKPLRGLRKLLISSDGGE
ncbi:hypothetical protein AUC68_12825 [Methyloceanibacter methanicus]|uniref:Sulfotransferase domain-containing protein n=1 Tax=Methyloceanibacter methanicus TaxID=1774968 RepID=A0A1E3W5Y0_9HYPH|nr:hypothetical protein AUC68_12825 [Methyloceanibacter methanicus]